MTARPEFLGAEHARAFDDADVARAYRFRVPYPDAVFPLLLRLVPARPGTVLDLGAGTGAIARRLAPLVERVDAVEPSTAMVEEGRRLGAAERVRWIVAAAETAPLAGPYDLATAGQSLHWMEWEVVLPRVAAALSPRAPLAILDVRARAPWEPQLKALIQRYSRNPAYRELDLPSELGRRGLFAVSGDRRLDPVRWRQPAEEYVESFHAMSSLTRRRLGQDATRFDEALRALLPAGDVELEIVARVTWGRPRGPAQAVP